MVVNNSIQAEDQTDQQSSKVVYWDEEEALSVC